MKTTIDKAGRVVISAAVRKRAGLEPGAELEVEADDFSVRLVRQAPRPRPRQGGEALGGPPSVPPSNRPAVDIPGLVEEERNRWP